MVRRPSPLTAILTLGICVFQLVLGGSGVLCAQGADDGRTGRAASVAVAATDPMPCHGEMQAPVNDARAHHSSHSHSRSRAPSRQGGCQPMAACAAGFVPAVRAALPAVGVWPPAAAIARPVQVLASLTFPPEPPPPRA